MLICMDTQIRDVIVCLPSSNSDILNCVNKTLSGKMGHTHQSVYIEQWQQNSATMKEEFIENNQYSASAPRLNI